MCHCVGLWVVVCAGECVCVSLWVSVCVPMGVCSVSVEGVTVYVSGHVCEYVLSSPCVPVYVSVSVYVNGCVCQYDCVSVIESRCLWHVCVLAM